MTVNNFDLIEILLGILKNKKDVTKKVWYTKKKNDNSVDKLPTILKAPPIELHFLFPSGYMSLQLLPKVG